MQRSLVTILSHLAVTAALVACDTTDDRGGQDGSDGALGDTDATFDDVRDDTADIDVGPHDAGNELDGLPVPDTQDAAVDADDGTMADADANDSDESPDAAPVLTASAGTSLDGTVGEAVQFDASASTGAVQWQWDFGDGNRQTAPVDSPFATHTYGRPGRFRAVVTAFAADGSRRSAGKTVSVVRPPIHTPASSSSLIALGDEHYALAVPDAGAVFRFSREGSALVAGVRIATCVGASTLARLGDALLVPCPSEDTLLLLDLSTGAALDRLVLDWGSQPVAVVSRDGQAWVTLSGGGQLVGVVRAGDDLQISHTIEGLADARGVSVLPDGRPLVARWRSPDRQGVLYAVTPDDSTVTPWTLAFDPQLASDTEAGGVLNWLTAPAVSPDGQTVIVGGTQANIDQGLRINDEALTFETTVRANLRFLETATGVENFGRSKQFDNRGMINALTFNPRGDYLFFIDPGHRSIERFDVLNQIQSGSILEAGYAPQGLVVSDDGRYLIVDAALSREVRLYDVSGFSELPTPLDILPSVTTEPLPPAVFRGKQLFNDAWDVRLARDGYIACSHCHLDGHADGLTWDFSDRGEGFRNTISLLGRAGLAHGPLHWSANFDEVHDFEGDIRGPFGGTGLLTDTQFAETGPDPLGPPRAGLSEDLDALAAYVTSLSTYPRSPARHPDGSLTEEATRGAALFADPTVGCTGCHNGPHLTDSGWLSPGVPNLHDVGTLSTASGQRLGGVLSGIDTPTLHDLWGTAPYLHDGRADTLFDVLRTFNPDDQHGVTSGLTLTQLQDLVAFLESLQGP